MTREVKLEEPVNQLLEDYARFIESSPDHVVNSVLKKLWRDQDYRKWRDQRRAAQAGASGKEQSVEQRGGLDAPSTRITRLHLGHPCDGRWNVPFLQAPISR